MTPEPLSEQTTSDVVSPGKYKALQELRKYLYDKDFPVYSHELESIFQIVKRGIDQQDPMTEEKAREILGKWISDDNQLKSHGMKLTKSFDRLFVTGTMYFTTDELEAIAWWMRNKKE